MFLSRLNISLLRFVKDENNVFLTKSAYYFFFHCLSDLVTSFSSLISCYEFIPFLFDSVRLWMTREKDPTPLSKNERCWTPKRNVTDQGHVSYAYMDRVACVGRLNGRLETLRDLSMHQCSRSQPGESRVALVVISRFIGDKSSRTITRLV